MRVPWRRLFLSTLTLVMTGCGSQQLVTQLWPWKQDPPAIASDLSQPFPRLPGTVASPGRKTEPNTADFDFDRREVSNYVDRFQSDLRNFYGRALERSARYVSFMEPILKQEGVPPELVYLPLIESGFQTDATSSAGAVGPWQFIRQTGRRYGLRIDNYVDERRDPVKSTEAAARYLRDLYDMFNDWHLSLAAYNTGEGNIARILERRGSDNDYWDMRQHGYIVRETREYVPRFLAALQIARSPETYGFDRPEDEPLAFDWVRINRPLSLDKVAELCGTSASEIRELNPALTRGVIPYNGYTVRIPKGMKRSFMEAAAKLPATTERYAATPHAGRRCSGMQTDGTYCLRTGETAASVAQRYGISTQALLNANDIRNPRRLTVGQALVIPGHRKKSAGGSYAAASRGQTGAATHRVRPGETLGVIATRYGMTPSALAHLNGMRNANHLRVGQVLQVRGGAGTATRATKVASAKSAAPAGSASAKASSTARRPPMKMTAEVPAVTDPPRRSAQRTHQVRPGESPATIAARYGISPAQLLQANGIRDARKVQAGKTLVIPAARSAAAKPAARSAAAKASPRASGATHTVRSGETLYSIAKRYRVALSALCSANGLREKSSIRPGQKLVIPKQVASK